MMKQLTVIRRWRKGYIGFPAGFALLVFMIFMSSCHKTNIQAEKGGYLLLTFQHSVDNSPLKTDTMMYVNAAGNPYLVTEIQYFISDVVIHKANGDSLSLTQYDDIHYTDTHLPETMAYRLPDTIPAGSYQSISFTFGINKEKNKSLMFVNPPESNMFWPEYLGGGYHYMKLNGKWRDPEGVIRPFNFHLGIGQVYDASGQITGFIQNYFYVHLPASSFEIQKGKITRVQLVMNVNEWFEDPKIFDFNVWGGDIMQKQEAMHIACENGHNVFSVESTNILLPE